MITMKMVPCVILNFKLAVLIQRLKSLTFYFDFWAVLLTCTISLLFCFSASFVIIFLIKSQAFTSIFTSFPFKDVLVPMEMGTCQSSGMLLLCLIP